MRDDEGDEAGGVGVGVADEWEGVLDSSTTTLLELELPSRVAASSLLKTLRADSRRENNALKTIS